MSNNNTSLTISSTTIRQDKEDRYCLNDCHRSSGAEKRHGPSYWLATNAAQELICQLDVETTGNTVVTQEGRNGGTFVAKELVYAYAMWISPAFHLQVIRAFDAMVTGQIPNTVSKPMDHVAMLRKAIALHGSALAFNKRQGMDLTQARLKAVATVKEQMGIDLPDQLGWQAQTISIQQRTVNATEIGRVLGMKNTEVNRLLETQGYHTGLRDMKLRRVWKPTNKGMKFGRYEDKAKKHSEGTVQPWVWFESIVDELRPFAQTPVKAA